MFPVETPPVPPAPAGPDDELAAEGALAAVGLEPWLRATPKFGATERMRASSMGKRLNKELLDFLGGEPVAVGPVHAITWKDAEALLYPDDPNTDHKRAEMLTRAMRNPRLAMAVQNVANRAAKYLQDHLPRVVVQSLAGDKTVHPSSLDWARFRDIWEVAAEPETVLKALAEGSLTADQIETVQALYPAMYSAIQQAAVDGVIAMKAKRAKWTLPPVKERLLATLRQVETAKLALGADIQAIYAGKGGPPQQTPAPAQATPKGLKANIAIQETPGQRAEGPLTE